MINKQIINGGDPLGDCPKDCPEARLIEDKLNNLNDEENGPTWKFDCGFKLDFDGPLITVSSRFYPPKTNYGHKWDGNLHIEIMGKRVSSKHFENDTLEQLTESVDAYLKEITEKLYGAFL